MRAERSLEITGSPGILCACMQVLLCSIFKHLQVHVSEGPGRHYVAVLLAWSEFWVQACCEFFVLK